MRDGGRAVAAAALVVAAALANAPAAGAATCKRSGEKVEAQNRYVQVVTGPDGDFACLRSTGRRHRLGFDGDSAVLRALVRYRYVAYTHAYYDGESEGQELELMNVRSGAVYELDSVPYASSGPFGSFVLKSNGATAWILDEAYADESGDPTPDVIVKRCSRRCLERNPREPDPNVLDRSPRIAPRSLRLAGSEISWREDGERRRATLR